MIPLCMAKDVTRTFRDRLFLVSEGVARQTHLLVRSQLMGLVDVRVYETVLIQTAGLNPDFRDLGRKVK
jgi:hypothetical protein